MMKLKFFGIFLFLLFVFPVSAVDEDDVQILGVELEGIFNLLSGFLATGLLTLTYFAYKISKQKRLLFVSFAFLLFAIKSYLMSTELFMEDIEFIDPLASSLDLGILISFFLGVVKK